MTEYPLCSGPLKECRAAGDPGTDMNGRTVLHGGARRATYLTGAVKRTVDIMLDKAPREATFELRLKPEIHATWLHVLEPTPGAR